MLSRRELLSLATPALAPASRSLNLPIHLIADARVNWAPGRLEHFHQTLWYEAERDFARCGIALDVTRMPGEVRRTPSDRPLFVGLARGVLNVVLTGQVPLTWDTGRCLSGVTTLFQGYHLCVIAVDYAHAHQIPLLSVNTCVHELLHVVMRDIFERRPQGWRGSAREFRIDLLATRLWLFGDPGPIPASAAQYVRQLRSQDAERRS